jgi:hypothetical protein
MERVSKAFAIGNVDGLAMELAPDYNASQCTMQPIGVE